MAASNCITVTCEVVCIVAAGWQANNAVVDGGSALSVELASLSNAVHCLLVDSRAVPLLTESSIAFLIGPEAEAIGPGGSPG